jgi:hypothetical protein
MITYVWFLLAWCEQGYAAQGHLRRHLHLHCVVWIQAYCSHGHHCEDWGGRCRYGLPNLLGLI